MTDVSPAVMAPMLWNYVVCGQYPGPVAAGVSVHLKCTTCMPAKRYVVVQFPVTDMANFCELEVYVRGKLL